MKNCLNCAAPLDMKMNKCPYCGTSYFDFSNIDIDNGEPVSVKIKVNGMEISFLAKPHLDSIEYTSDYTFARNLFGETVANFNCGTSLFANLNLEAIQQNKELFHIIKKN